MLRIFSKLQLFLYLLVCISGCGTTASHKSIYSNSRMNNLPELVAGKLAIEDISIGDIVIGKSNFDHVFVKYGKAELFSNGESAPNQVCYKSTDKGDNTILLFQSGPMGSWKTITTISITHSTLWKQADRCSTSILVNREIKTESGLGIDVNKSVLIQHIGTPTIMNRDFIGYYLVTKEEGWTIISIMEVFLKKDSINAMTLHQIDTN